MLRELKEKEPEEIIIGQIEKIIERFRKYIPVGKVEKKSFGEVFTPFSLVNEMLDTLPVEVWSNPNLKWADLCNGMGNFMIIIIKRLMIGLESWEPNESKRYKHIIENMIYVGELQPKNMFLWILSIDPKSKLKLNIYRGDTLKPEFDKFMKEEWKVDKFDIMVSNPPYQELKEGFKKSQPLWHLFVEMYLNLLEENGYMVMIHPSGWRDVDGAFKMIQKLLLKNMFLYLAIFKESDGLKMFNADTRFDYYCLKKSDKYDLTIIKNQNNIKEKIYLKNMEFIPNANFDIIKKLIANEDEESVTIISDSSYHTQHTDYMSKNKTNKHVYPCVYTVKSGDEITLWWSSVNDKGHFKIPKLIWSNFRIISAGSIIDIDGDYGLTQFSYAIVDDIKNLPLIKTAFDSKRFRNLMESCSVANMSINRKVISTFRKDFWKEFIDENDPE